MDGALYRRALRCAERLFSEMSAKHVIDGRDAHDFAIDSIMRNPSTWTCDRVKFDIEVDRRGKYAAVNLSPAS